MPTPCYISITGQTQGNITAGAFTADSVGNIYVQGHEDEMLVQEFLHNVTVPTDPQSGQPAGQRAHKPFIFTVALNKAVPLMYNALASGEMLPTTELHWWRTSAGWRRRKASSFMRSTRKKVPTRAWSCAIPCVICRSPLRSPGIRTPVPR